MTSWPPALKTLHPGGRLVRILIFLLAVGTQQLSSLGQSPVELIQRGMEQARSGEFDTAVATISRVIQADPLNYAAWLFRSRVKVQAEDYDGAFADLTQAIEIQPSIPTGYHERGFVRLQQEDYPGAIEDESRMIKTNPSYGDAYFNRAFAKEKLGDSRGAIADYSRAIEVDPLDAGAYANRASVKDDIGDVQGAKADYFRAAEIEPQTHFLRLLGDFLADHGDQDGAIAVFSRAIEVDAEDHAAYALRAALRLNAGDVDSAISDYSRAIAIEEDEFLYWAARGNAKSDKHDFPGALADLRKAAQLAPDDDEDAVYVQLRLWLIRARIGERAAATSDLASFIRARQGANPDSWVLTLARFLAGQMTETSMLAAAKSSDPTVNREHECDAYFYAGWKRLVDGDIDTARAHFEKSAATNVTSFFEWSSARAELRALGPRR